MTALLEHPVAIVPHRSGAMAFLAPAALIAGEDAAAYDDLLARIAGAVKPADILEEVWMRDVVELVWEAIRLRRYKAGLMAASASRGMAEVLRALGETQPNSLARRWAAREETAVVRVNARLAAAGLGIDAVMASTLAARIDEIERIDRLTMAAEARRAVALRELDRHRAELAQSLRRAAQEVEDAELATVAPPDGENGAPGQSA
jgi:hypothetical protein